MSRTGLSPSDIAESFRDRCGDGSVEWVYTPTHAWVLLDAADMLDENDKLRELVQVMAYCMQEFRDCECCAANGAEGVVTAPSGCDWLRDRMRELGVVE